MSGGGPVGRFAPSPTGRLHLGSLLAAVASYCQARSKSGQWLVRMEDLDPPRELSGAADDILRTLEGFGFQWDGEVLFQSRRHDRYAEALVALKEGGCVYPCGCSRKEWYHLSAYPGTCRQGLLPGRQRRLDRFRLSGRSWSWPDLFRGEERFETASMADFPVLRADGFWAYQLAVVVDDRDQGITEVVRGADLIDSTPGQMDLWSALSIAEGVKPMPVYGHVPILQTLSGQKLSKQTLARPIDVEEACALIACVWRLLGQSDSGAWSDAVEKGDPRGLMSLAVRLWMPEQVPSEPIQLQGWGQDDKL